MDDGVVRLRALVDGRVQGVGFRDWVRACARELQLAGSAANLDDGKVEVIVEGSDHACQRMLESLRGPDAPGRVIDVTEQWSPPRGDVANFTTR